MERMEEIENISLVSEEVKDKETLLRQRETELLAILEALQNVKASRYWKLLEEKVLNGVMQSLQQRIKNEKNPTEIYRLQGQIVWAEKFCDLTKMYQAYQNELNNIRQRPK